MESFVAYWEHIPSSHRILILMGGMVVFWLIEGYYPLFKFSYKDPADRLIKPKRYAHVGVIKMRKQSSTAAIEKINPYRYTNQQNAYYR